MRVINTSDIKTRSETSPCTGHVVDQHLPEHRFYPTPPSHTSEASAASLLVDCEKCHAKRCQIELWVRSVALLHFKLASETVNGDGITAKEFGLLVCRVEKDLAVHGYDGSTPETPSHRHLHFSTLVFSSEETTCLETPEVIRSRANKLRCESSPQSGQDVFVCSVVGYAISSSRGIPLSR